MHFLLSCTTDSSSQAEAHLKFYRPIEHLKKFGVTIQRGFGCFDLYTPTDGYDLPKPKKYGSINTYMLYVDSTKFSQFFRELSQYSGCYESEDSSYTSEQKIVEKLRFLEEYNIPIHNAEPDMLDNAFIASGISSLKDFCLLIHNHINDDSPNFASIQDSISLVDEDLRFYMTELLDRTFHRCKLSRFPNYDSLEKAFVLNIASKSGFDNKEEINKTPPEAFLLGHFVAPYHPSFKKLNEVASYLYCDDISTENDNDKFFDVCFARAKEFIPNLSQEQFDNDSYQVIADCIFSYQNSIIAKFNVPEDYGKSDFLIPLNYFEKTHYTDDDHQKSLEISSQMSAEVYEAMGPGLSSFETGDD